MRLSASVALARTGSTRRSTGLGGGMLSLESDSAVHAAVRKTTAMQNKQDDRLMIASEVVTGVTSLRRRVLLALQLRDDRRLYQPRIEPPPEKLVEGDPLHVEKMLHQEALLEVSVRRRCMCPALLQ